VWLGYGNNRAAAWPLYEQTQSPGSPSSEFPTNNLTNFDFGKEKFKILRDQGLAYCLNIIGNEIRNV